MANSARAIPFPFSSRASRVHAVSIHFSHCIDHWLLSHCIAHWLLSRCIAHSLLSRIKNEYDLVLHQYSQQLHALNATQFKVASESLSQAEDFLKFKNNSFDEIAKLKAQIESMTKDQETRGKSLETIQEQVHYCCS